MTKELLSSALVQFMNNLNDDEKQSLGLNIFNKYFENKSIEQGKKARSLLFIYSRLKANDRNGLLKEKYYQWKRLSFEINLSHLLMSKSSGINGSHVNGINKSKTKINRVNTKEGNGNEKSWIKKEKEELAECTFKPQINENYEAIHRPNEIYESLYTDHERYKNKKNIRKLEIEKRESLGYSFNPDTSLTNIKNNNLLKYSNKSENQSRSLIKSNFYERQQQYIQMKSKSRDRIKKELEEDEVNLCTFSPQILKKKYDDYLPFQVRLHEDNMQREKKHAEAEKHKIERNNSKPNLTSNDKNVNSGGNINSLASSNNNKIDIKKIEELYNDYKRFNMKKREMQREIDKERGITFKPEIYKNDKFTPKLNFNERNNKLLDDKKKFLTAFNKIYEENLKKGTLIDSSKKHLPEEVSEITQRVIERLYEKGREKVANRNSVDSINEREKMYYERILRQDHIKLNSNYSVQLLKKNGKKNTDDINGNYSNINVLKSYDNKVNPSENYTFGRKDNNTKGKTTNMNIVLTESNQNVSNIYDKITYSPKDEGSKTVKHKKKLDDNHFISQLSIEDDNIKTQPAKFTSILLTGQSINSNTAKEK
jgi:hypothetical protein